MPAVLLDRRSPMPLWAQVCDDLRRRIGAEEFASAFPGELALTEEYEVSRYTVREALRVLRDEGLVTSHRGRPSRVEARRYRQSLGALYSLFDSMTEQGVRQTNDVLRLAPTHNATVAAHLDQADDADLIVLERLRLANGEALAHDVTWMPASIAAPLLDIDFTATGLYAELQRTCNVRVDAGRERITTTLAPRHIAQLLSISSSDPVFLFERQATAQSRPVIWRETHIRGDHFSLETEWTSSSTTLTASTEMSDLP